MIEKVKSLLLRKWGPVPVWVYFLVGVLGVAFILKRRADAAKASGPDDQSAALENMAFPNAQPMNYSSDIFISLPAPVVTAPGTPGPNPPGSGGPVTTIPPKYPRPRMPYPNDWPRLPGGGVVTTDPPMPPVPRPGGSGGPVSGPFIPPSQPPTKSPTTPNPLPPSKSPTPAPIPKTKSLTYVVKSGDTLWDIAKKYLGGGNNASKIYQANKTLLDSEAKKHGFANSNNGSRIWAGEKLVIPVG